MNYTQSISAIVTLFNKKNTIEPCLTSLLEQPMTFKDIFVIDDGSTDGAIDIVLRIAKRFDNVHLILHDHRGIAYSLNEGIKMADTEYIVVVDGDAVLEKRWIEKILPHINEENIAAVSGLIKLANSKNLWAAVAGYNLEFRQLSLKTGMVDQLSTCNTLYKKSALEKVGLFNTGFHYGQDNDLSYRLIRAGYKLILEKKTFCLHYWPENLNGFFRQRFNGAIGRLRLSRRHPGRWKGDVVSRLSYFLELPLTLLTLFTLALSFIDARFVIVFLFILLGFYLYVINESLYLVSKRKTLIAIFLPIFSIIRSIAWLSGIICFKISKRFKSI